MRYTPKLSHSPPLIKQFNLPSHNDNIKASPPPRKSLFPLIHSYLVYLLDFVLRTASLQLNDSSTYVEESFEESSESLDSELVSSSYELGDSSSSIASLALRFPRAWVRTRSINSALLPLTLLNNEFDPSIYGTQQAKEIDYDTLSLFSSGTDKAYLRDLLNSRSFAGGLTV